VTCCAIFNNSLCLHCSQVLLHFIDVLPSINEKIKVQGKAFIRVEFIETQQFVMGCIHIHVLVTIIYSKLGLFDNTRGRLPSIHLLVYRGRGKNLFCYIS
jgi:hypothetical protein